MLRVSIKGLFLGGLLLLNSGCSFLNSKSSGKVQFKLPEKKSGFSARSLRKSQTRSIAAGASGSLWGLTNQTSIEESDCYAITLHGADLPSGSCMGADETSVFPVSQFFGFYKAGDSVSLDVPIGSNRTIAVYSLVSADGTCGGAFDQTFNSQKYSQPVLVGTKTLEVTSGTNEVALEISMKEAKPVELCSGKPFAEVAGSIWPSCTLSVAGVNQSGGELQLSGQCLASTSKVQMVNTSTNQTYDMAVVSKNQNQLRLKPMSSNLSIVAKAVYQILVTNALGETTSVSYSLTLDDVVSFPILKDANGAVVGDIVPMGGGMQNGSNYAVINSSGDLLNYFSMDGSYSASKLYLLPSFITIGSTLADTSFKQLAKMGMLPYVQSWIGFSNADCTGDVIIPNYNTKLLVRGSIIVQPKGCTMATAEQGGQYWTCTGWDYFKLSGAPTMQKNVMMNSTFNQGYYYGNSSSPEPAFGYCNSSYSYSQADAAVYSSTQKIPFGPNDPPTVLTAPSIVGR